jgi:hypothetical protein
MKSTAFKSLTHALQADFGYAVAQFKSNSGSANFNALTDAALALQQIEWIGRTSTVTASERELIAKQVLELPTTLRTRRLIKFAYALIDSL